MSKCVIIKVAMGWEEVPPRKGETGCWVEEVPHRIRKGFLPL